MQQQQSKEPQLFALWWKKPFGAWELYKDHLNHDAAHSLLRTVRVETPNGVKFEIRRAR